MTTLRNEKILFAGLTGQIGFPLASYLAKNNQVWGLARFRDEAKRQQLEAMGVTTRAIDLAAPDFHGLPDDFTYVIHFAVYQERGDGGGPVAVGEYVQAPRRQGIEPPIVARRRPHAQPRAGARGAQDLGWGQGGATQQGQPKHGPSPRAKTHFGEYWFGRGFSMRRQINSIHPR